jgi:hypothetical protein
MAAASAAQAAEDRAIDEILALEEDLERAQAEAVAKVEQLETRLAEERRRAEERARLEVEAAGRAAEQRLAAELRVRDEELDREREQKTNRGGNPAGGTQGSGGRGARSRRRIGSRDGRRRCPRGGIGLAAHASRSPSRRGREPRRDEMNQDLEPAESSPRRRLFGRRRANSESDGGAKR